MNNSLQQKSELVVITKTKDLCSYIFVITNKSPKRFRFTLVSRLQNLSLEVLENIYMANEAFIINNEHERLKKRLALQYSALTKLKLFTYISLLALEQSCILSKQYEQLTKISSDCQYLLGSWVKNTQKRLL